MAEDVFDDRADDRGYAPRALSHEDSIRIRLGEATSVPGELVFNLTMLLAWNVALYFTGLFNQAHLSFDPVLISEILCHEFVFFMIVYSLQSAQVSISLFMIAIYFSLFLLYPGIHHALTNSFPFYGMSYNDHQLLNAVGMLGLFLVAVMLGYVFGARRAGPGGAIAREILVPRLSVGMGLLFIATLAAAVGIAKAGFHQFVFVRGAMGEQNVAAKSDIGFFLTLPRALTFVSLLYWVTALRYGARGKGFSILMLAYAVPLFLIVNFPPALPRFVLFGYALGLVMLLADLKRKRARYWLFIGFVGGALFAMPIANALTRGHKTLSTIKYEEVVGNYLESGDFDGLQSMNNAVIYVDKYGYQLGLQLASAALFYVPRSVWPGKSEPTGSVTAQAAGYKFLNISQPLPSEFYVDFGLGGVAALSLLLGFGLGRLDAVVDRNMYARPTIRLWSGFVAGYGVILLRGPLLGVIAVAAINAAGVYIVTRWGFIRVGAPRPMPPRPAPLRQVPTRPAVLKPM